MEDSWRDFTVRFLEVDAPGLVREEREDGIAATYRVAAILC
jgi:hypothetical protein